jgi:hypothetical protein
VSRRKKLYSKVFRLLPPGVFARCRHGHDHAERKHQEEIFGHGKNDFDARVIRNLRANFSRFEQILSDPRCSLTSRGHKSCSKPVRGTSGVGMRQILSTSKLTKPASAKPSHFKSIFMGTGKRRPNSEFSPQPQCEFPPRRRATSLFPHSFIPYSLSLFFHVRRH